MSNLTRSIKESPALAYRNIFKTITDKWGGVHGSVRISLEVETGRIYALKGVIEKNINSDLQISDIIRHENLLNIYDCIKMGNKYYLKEEACECSIYDIINKNAETHFIPSESELIHVWLSILKGIEALDTCNQIHGNIKETNILYNDGRFMLSDPLYLFKNDERVSLEKDIKKSGEIIRRYSGYNIETNEYYGISEKLIKLINDVIDGRIKHYKEIFKHELFIKYQYNHLNYSINHKESELMDLPLLNNENEVMQFMKDISDLESDDNNFKNISDFNDILRKIQTLTSDSQDKSISIYGLKIFLNLSKNREWAQKMHQTFPDYKIWRMAGSVNYLPFEMYRLFSGDHLSFDSFIDTSEERAYYQLLIMCSYFSSCEIIKIRSLDISSKYMSEIIGYFYKLKSLSLINVNLTLSKLQGLHDIFNQLSSLRNLDLSKNGIKSEEIKELGSVLCHNSLLRGLDLSENSFDLTDIKTLTKSFPPLYSINQLILNKCNLNDDSLIELSNHFHGMHNLQYLLLSNNEITDESMDLFSNRLPLLYCLVRLDLTENSISDVGFKKIIEPLTIIPSFDRICVTGNNITSDGYIYFVEKNIEHFLSIRIDEKGFLPEWSQYMKLLISPNPLESIIGITQLVECMTDDIQRNLFCWLGGIFFLIKNLASNNALDVIPAILLLNNISSNQHCLTYACSYGIIPVILSYLNINNNNIQNVIKNLIVDITLIERFIPEIVNNNGILTFVNVLRNTDNPNVKDSMCTALWNVSEHFDENKKIISNCGGIPYIDNCVNIQSDDTILISAVGLLWNLACHPDLTICIKNTSVTRLILSYVTSTNDRLKIYSYGFAFTTNNNNIDTEAGVRFLLQQCQTDDKYKRANSTHAICNYIDSNYNDLSYINREGIDIISSLLEHDYFEELYYACCALYKLIKNEYEKDYIVSHLNVDRLTYISEKYNRETKYMSDSLLDMLDVRYV